jgi:hypothetical protein
MVAFPVSALYFGACKTAGFSSAKLRQGNAIGKRVACN